MAKDGNSLVQSILVVVLNWNGDQDLIDCLESLERGHKTSGDTYEVLVVDNASTSGSLAQAERRYKRVNFLRLPQNRYWAGGNNDAVAWALERNYDWIVLSNSDIVVDPSWHPALLQVAEETNIGAVGFKIFGEAQRVPFEEFENYRASFSLKKLTCHEDLYISGCFLACRSRCFAELGLFDETYKMYCEEFDFLTRVRLAGWRTVRCNAPIYHVSELASRKVPLLTSYFAIRNNMRVRIKFGPRRLWDPVKYALRVLLRMLNCFDKVDLVDSCRRREKPTDNLLINLGIWTRACLWNLFFLPNTLLSRRKDLSATLSARAAAQS